MDSIEILKSLIAFPTVSRDSNLALIAYVRDLLAAHGIAATLIHSRCGSKANLFATIGPVEHSGIMLSGHTDVVPADEAGWTVPPFEMTDHQGRLHGRGAADMKGFLACALAAALRAKRLELASPLHLAFSYDEEVGCVGVRSLIDRLAGASIRPRLCIVGEPTGLEVATGHKGKISARAHCRGRGGHSALAPNALNAIHLGCDLIALMRTEQDALVAQGARDEAFEVPYSTIHAGIMQAGTALNIVPSECVIDFEIRNIPRDDSTALLARLKAGAEQIAGKARSNAPEAAIDITVTNGYPSLDTPVASDAVAFVKSLTGANDTIKVAFGTEGGLFDDRLAVPTVICGPGSMAQGHKPDEFVTREQMTRCDEMLNALLERLRV